MSTPASDLPPPAAPGNGHHSLPMRLQELKDEAEALALRLSGLSYRGIAETQGCSVSTAHARVKQALASYVPKEDVDELRSIEGERLEAAISRVLLIIGTRDTPPLLLLEAAKTLVSLQNRKAKLYGLDTPVVQKVEVTHLEQIDRDIERLMEELGASG